MRIASLGARLLREAGIFVLPFEGICEIPLNHTRGESLA
jgi:hypothetical protein